MFNESHYAFLHSHPLGLISDKHCSIIVKCYTSHWYTILHSCSCRYNLKNVYEKRTNTTNFIKNTVVVCKIKFKLQQLIFYFSDLFFVVFLASSGFSGLSVGYGGDGGGLESISSNVLLGDL